MNKKTLGIVGIILLIVLLLISSMIDPDKKEQKEKLSNDINVIIANAQEESEEYKKQRALYMLCIREWNKDHPSKEQQLNYNDDLPTPYSYQEILAIK